VTGPRRPAHFTAAQKLICRAGARTLDAMGVLTKADGWALERYVVTFVRWRECELLIAQNGMTYAVRSDDPSNYVGRPPDGSAAVGSSPTRRCGSPRNWTRRCARPRTSSA
jgi:hypothetical protein